MAVTGEGWAPRGPQAPQEDPQALLYLGCLSQTPRGREALHKGVPLRCSRQPGLLLLLTQRSGVHAAALTLRCPLLHLMLLSPVLRTCLFSGALLIGGWGVPAAVSLSFKGRGMGAPLPAASHGGPPATAFLTGNAVPLSLQRSKGHPVKAYGSESLSPAAAAAAAAVKATRMKEAAAAKALQPELPQRQQALECTVGGSSPRKGRAAADKEEDAAEKDRIPITAETVDHQLNDIRPLLNQHGGSVRLVYADAQARKVTLQLQGACVGCPSAAATLKLGIERSLQEVWPGLKVVEAPSPAAAAAAAEENSVTASQVEVALKGILPAVQNMGGRLSVTENPSGGVTVRYEGPNAVTVKYGLEVELRDKLPGATSLINVKADEVAA
ncbi:hypothetical protein Esti_002008 [Eimeria stiedai]